MCLTHSLLVIVLLSKLMLSSTMINFLWNDQNLALHVDPTKLRQDFGPSNEFVKTLLQGENYKPNMMTNGGDKATILLEEIKLLASCSYESGTKWGQEASKLSTHICTHIFTWQDEALFHFIWFSEIRTKLIEGSYVLVLQWGRWDFYMVQWWKIT